MEDIPRSAAQVLADHYISSVRERQRQVPLTDTTILTIALIDVCQDNLRFVAERQQARDSAFSQVIEGLQRTSMGRPAQTAHNAPGEAQTSGGTHPSDDSVSPRLPPVSQAVSPPSEVKCPNCEIHMQEHESPYTQLENPQEPNRYRHCTNCGYLEKL